MGLLDAMGTLANSKPRQPRRTDTMKSRRTCSRTNSKTLGDVVEMAFIKNKAIMMQKSSCPPHSPASSPANSIHRASVRPLRSILLQHRFWTSLQQMFTKQRTTVVAALAKTSALTLEERQAVCSCHKRQGSLCNALPVTSPIDYVPTRPPPPCAPMPKACAKVLINTSKQGRHSLSQSVTVRTFPARLQRSPLPAIHKRGVQRL
jgi:predicted DNA-binding ribbon-helix-helix protein